MANNRFSFVPQRQILLIEIERYCQQSDCSKLNRVGLTETEAREYDGFTCERCENWNSDTIKSGELPPEWNVNR
jgi:hypothetical protein